MSHLITASDTVGIVGGKGWHGLGTQIETTDCLTALTRLRLNWDVIESPIVAKLPNGTEVNCSEKKALLRSDNSEVVGVVGKNFRPLQNVSLASLADSLSCCNETPVQVDTIGSLDGGKRFFIGLTGDSTVIGGDEMYQHLILANAHDGSSSVRIHPTATRVVCNNTYTGSQRDSHLGFTWRHSSNFCIDRIEVANILADWRSRLNTAKDFGDQLAAIEATHKRCQELWMAVYEDVVGHKIPTNPQSDNEERRKNRAVNAMQSMAKIFDAERGLGCKPSMWLASQAATNWIQNVNGRTKVNDGERSISKMLGFKAHQTSAAMSIAAKNQ